MAAGPDAALEVRAVMRRPLSERWSREELQAVRVVPWAWRAAGAPGADEVDSAVAQLERAVPALLEGLKLPHGAVTVNGTPRRLAVEVEALATRQPDREERTRGPPAKAAFDAEGAPTKAILGFCKKNGAAVEDVEATASAAMLYFGIF